MSVIGVGIDIARIDRIRGILDGAGGEGFIRATFTDAEILTVEQHADVAERYATLFAVKEAVFKCLRVAFEEADGFRDIEVSENHVGAPSVTLSGRFAQLLSERHATTPTVSVSFEDDYAVAVAVLETRTPS